MKILANITLIFLLLPSSFVFSQDIIITKNLDSIFCNIKEINTKIIKYDSTKYSNNVDFEISREDVFKVFFENKEEVKINSDSLNFNVYRDNKKNALKLHLLSVFGGHVALSYERSINLGSSLEFGASYIFGIQQNHTIQKGGTARFGYKFIKLRDYNAGEVRYMHIMKGTYFKPEIILSAFNSKYEFLNHDGFTDTHSEDLYAFSLMLNYGVQYVYDNSFLLDFYIGAGGSIASPNEEYFYSNIAITDNHSDFGLSITLGIKIGGLF